MNALIKKKEHVFVLGPNGCGKSTLLKIITGKDSADRGQVEFGYNVQVGYYDQEIQQLTDSNTVLDEIKEIFVGMGFSILDGPEVETSDYNFTRLNTPANHPAREWTDTFYFEEDSSVLLRTQTSPMQIRAMEELGIPIRVIVPGRVYRKDEVDATHSPMFHQIEGLVVDKGITMADLKGTLNMMVEQLYGKGTVTRFRPHHFPFTEPSCEMDIQCHKCGGKGCPTCKGEGWIEVLGAGMVHPKVLAGCGIDPDVYSGWAFGMGLERLAMGEYKITDLRLIFENDVRFLHQFPV